VALHPPRRYLLAACDDDVCFDSVRGSPGADVGADSDEHAAGPSLLLSANYPVERIPRLKRPLGEIELLRISLSQSAVPP
jgi:hypothetical protein